MRTQTFDKEKVSFNLLKYEKYGLKFEAIIDPDKAMHIIEEKLQDSQDEIRDLLKAQEIFKNSKNVERANNEDLLKVFGTEDPLKIATEMLKKGELQLTAEYRKKLNEKKYAQIVNSINRDCSNPRTGSPIPLARIKNALIESKFTVNVHKRIDDQIEDAIKQIALQIPITRQEVTLILNAAPEVVHILKKTLSQTGKTIKETWLNDGHLEAYVKVPSGRVEFIKTEIKKYAKDKIQVQIQ